MVALLIGGTSLIHASPASALIQRGHVFGGSFGERFDGENKLAKPSGTAVDEASTGEAAGDVYVLDTANNRIVRFGPPPEHQFIEAWGYGVATGADAYETCTGNCQPGVAGFKKGQLDGPVAIAVDNASGSPSRGDVYVVANRTWKKAVIDKFSPSGVLLGRLISKREEKEEVHGMIDGVAVDSSGTVWVEREDEEEEFTLQRFNDQTPNKPLEEPSELEIENLEGPRPARPGFAVDSQGDIYTTYEPNGHDSEQREEEAQEIAEREKERKKDHEQPKDEHPQEPCEQHPCLVAKLALAPGLSGVEAQPLIYELDGSDSTGVAVELSTGTQSSDDVYLDNGTSVAAFTSTGTLIQRFGSAQLADGGGSGLTVDASTGEVLVADASAGRIDVFTLSPPGPPVVEQGSLSAAHVSSSAAELRASIDPSGAATHYRFQYGTAVCADNPSACAEQPAGGAGSGGYIGQGFGDETAAVEVAGLAPSTTYHFRMIAENDLAEGPQAVYSEERAFTTQSAAAQPLLPDGRAWELVSPPDTHGASIEPIAREGGLVQAAADGRSITYMADAPIGEHEPEGNRAPERAQIFSTRTSTGWSSQDIATPNTSAQGIRGGLTREYQLFSTDLQQALVEPPSEASPSLPAQTIYLRDNSACETATTEAATASCYVPLLTGGSTGDVTAESQFASRVAVAGATPDLSHVILQAGVPLTKGATGTGLYEWTAGRPATEALQLISVLPGGAQANESVSLGGGSVREMSSTAISTDGTRVVWRTGGNGEGHLYMRELAQGQTLEVDQPDSGAPAPELAPAPVFQTASADGSRVFFTDSQRLTAESTAPEAPAGAPPRDLYVFEPARPAGERLTDLTPDLNDGGEGAGVQGSVLAGSEGSLVYFVANGVLAAGAQPGDCRFDAPTGAGCSLYVVHHAAGGWESPRFIARLSGEDAPDWGRPEPGSNYELKTTTSRVSPDGEYLAFMSNRSLTGYNNLDARSNVADEEVYLYHYGTPAAGAGDAGAGGAGAGGAGAGTGGAGAGGTGAGSLVCASCDPSGAQPAGIYDTEESGEGIGLLVDRPQVWGAQYAGVDHWLAASVPGWTPIGLLESLYQSRYLSNDGRLFFNSADSLVPRDINGKEDVYEYEPVGVGGCAAANTAGGCVALISSGESEQESAFLDASETGNDVFFLTSAKLSPLELETTFDVYDARVCEAPGAEPCASPTAAASAPCDSEASCRPAPLPQASHTAPASSTVSGSGNLTAGHGQALASKSTQAPKAKLTRAQQLARALKACRSKKRKSLRVACERKAHKRYGVERAKAKGSRAGRASAGGSALRTRRKGAGR